jgi:hypothetical protein
VCHTYLDITKTGRGNPQTLKGTHELCPMVIHWFTPFKSQSYFVRQRGRPIGQIQSDPCRHLNLHTNMADMCPCLPTHNSYTYTNSPAKVIFTDAFPSVWYSDSPTPRQFNRRVRSIINPILRVKVVSLIDTSAPVSRSTLASVSFNLASIIVCLARSAAAPRFQYPRFSPAISLSLWITGVRSNSWSFESRKVFGKSCSPSSLFTTVPGPSRSLGREAKYAKNMYFFHRLLPFRRLLVPQNLPDTVR